MTTLSQILDKYTCTGCIRFDDEQHPECKKCVRYGVKTDYYDNTLEVKAEDYYNEQLLNSGLLLPGDL